MRELSLLLRKRRRFRFKLSKSQDNMSAPAFTTHRSFDGVGDVDNKLDRLTRDKKAVLPAPLGPSSKKLLDGGEATV